MSATSLVSIVIPVFNAEHYLEDCLNSAIQQTQSEIEIICINDGSTDSSGQILKRFETLDSRVFVFSQPNLGLSVARNRGLTRATGEYVMFLDSDDALELEAVEKLLAICRDQNLDALFFDAVELNSSYGESSEAQPSYSCEPDTGPRFLLQDLNQRGWKPSACLQISRRSLLNKFNLRFEPGILHEDNLYTAQLLLNASRVAHTEEALYRVRATPGSITRQETSELHVIGLLVCHSTLSDSLQDSALALSWRERIAFHYVLADIMSNAVLKSQFVVAVKDFSRFLSSDSRLGVSTKKQFSWRRIGPSEFLSWAIRLPQKIALRLTF
jgi:hypothetical protein